MVTLTNIRIWRKLRHISLVFYIFQTAVAGIFAFIAAITAYRGILTVQSPIESDNLQYYHDDDRYKN